MSLSNVTKYDLTKYDDQAHPEDRRDVDGWFEEYWKGRPETRGLEGAVGERRTDVEAIEAVGQE